ncbi:hypothetical protein SUGI_1069480 [Cryptomeria japonica]|nr:hypothetical protein SUGI_1069480 [Cryptomeria japonica]
MLDVGLLGVNLGEFGVTISKAPSVDAGYWGLYLASVNVGYHLYFLKKPISARIVCVDDQSRLLIEVWLLCGLFWGLTILFDQFVEKISHRMCNFTYTSFVLAVNAEILVHTYVKDY